MTTAIVIKKYRRSFHGEKDRQKRKLIDAALDAFVRLQRKRRISANDLEPIVAAARCRFRAVWDMGTDLLLYLSTRHSAARVAVREILRSRKVNERFQMVASLSPDVPKALAIELIRAALEDKGNRVREKAAEAADRLGLKEVLPDMEKQLRIERHRNAKSSLEFHVAMVRDGYFLQYENGGPNLWVRNKDGWGGALITQDDVDQGRLQAIIADARSEAES